jgi:Kef-type K+ transport system membrane component KefB
MSAHAVGQLLLGLAVIITLARVFGTAARRIGQPPVIGEILAGVLIGPTLFGTTVVDQLFPTAEVRPALAGLANVGLVLFMFIVGYELDHALVRGAKRVAVSVSVGSVLIPFGLGVALALWLARHHGVSRVPPFALFIGAAMSVTAFPVLARILTDRGMHRIEVGSLALASAAVDDVVAWSLLAVVVMIGSSGGGDQWHLLFTLPYLLVMLLAVRPLLRRLRDARQRAGRLTPHILAVVLVGLLLSCYLTEWLGLHAIFGAFLFGAVMPRTGGAVTPAGVATPRASSAPPAGADVLRAEILERLEQVSVLLLLPVFFVFSGMRVDLSTLDLRGVLELSLILLVAIVGKFAGAYAGARLCRVPGRQAGALATLMNTRGLTEIVILTVGLQLKILDTQLFSMMVVMALVTTSMAGPLLRVIYPRRRVEREVAAAERAALGVTEAYRLLVVVPPVDPEAAEATDATVLVRLGADLVGGNRPAEVVLSQMLPYRTRELAAGSGLTSELLEMTVAMEELAKLAGPVRAPGVATPVLARFSADIGRDLAAQVTAVEPAVLVVAQDQAGYAAVRAAATGRLVTLAAPPPAPWPAVLVRATGDDNGEAALQVGAQLAAAHSVELVVNAGNRPPRRVAAALRELHRRATPARLGSDALPHALVIAAEGGPTVDAHLLVRAHRDASDAAAATAAGWASTLVPVGTAPPTGSDRDER